MMIELVAAYAAVLLSLVGYGLSMVVRHSALKEHGRGPLADDGRNRVAESASSRRGAA